jgi:acyl-CoA dehydrogenase
MIIFGQGAIRGHPCVLREIAAVAETDRGRAVRDFDSALFGHIAFVASNKARALWMGLTGARFVRAPGDGTTRGYYRQLTRLSSAFAFAADVSMFVLGGSLKRRERLSARLGDILSQLYLASAALKRFEDDGRPAEDLPLLDWSVQDALTRVQEAFYGLCENLPGRVLPAALRFIVFPWGRPFRAASDSVGAAVCNLVLAPGAPRDRLTAGMYIGADGPVATLDAALVAAIEAEPIEQKLRAQLKAMPAGVRHDDIGLALAQGLISEREVEIVERARALRRAAIMVDDFPKDLGRTEIYQTTEPVRAPRRTRAV